MKNVIIFLFSCMCLFASSVVVELADDIGFVDDITINGREFDSLAQREIKFYTEDLKDGKIIVQGLLESQDKAVDVAELHVEITVDGGDTWGRAEGNDTWEWSFEPELEKNYEFSLRIVKEGITSSIEENGYEIPKFLYISGFKLTLADSIVLRDGKISGRGKLEIPYLQNFALTNEIDVDFENLRFFDERVTLGTIRYENLLQLQSEVADIDISSIIIDANRENNYFEGSVKFKGLLDFLPALSFASDSKLLPDSLRIKVPISATNLDIWSAKNVRLTLDEGEAIVSYRMGDISAKLDTRGLVAKMDFGSLLKASKEQITSIKANIGLNDAREYILSFTDLPKAYLLSSDIALEGINATFNTTSKTIQIQSSVNLDDYDNPLFQALSGSLMSAVISSDGFEGQISADSGLDPMIIVNRGGRGRDVRLSVFGTPSVSMSIVGNEVSLGLGELSALVDFGDVLQTTNLIGSTNSLRATIINTKNKVKEYTLNFEDNSKAYLLGSDFALDNLSATLDFNNNSIHVESTANFKLHQQRALKALNGSQVVLDISKESISGVIASSGMSEPMVILDRGSDSKDVKLEFLAPSEVSFSVTNNDIDFGYELGNARLHFGDLLENSIVELEEAQDGIYNWSINGAKKLASESKATFSDIRGQVNLQDLSDPKVIFNANVDLSGYGGLFSNVLNISIEDAVISKDGLVATISPRIGDVDIWSEKAVSLTFVKTPVIELSLNGNDFDISFSRLQAQLNFGSLLDGATARVSENLVWQIDGRNKLANSKVFLENLSGSLNIDDLSNPSINFDALVDISRYGVMFEQLRSVEIQNSIISKDGMSGSFSTLMSDIDIWRDKNVKLVFDENIPQRFSLDVSNEAVEIKIEEIRASIFFGSVLNGASARVQSLGEGIYSWRVGGEHVLEGTSLLFKNLFGRVDLTDLQNPSLNIDARVDLRRYANMFNDIKSARLIDGFISKAGFSGSLSVPLGDIYIWQPKNVKVNFADEVTLSISMTRDDFSFAISDIDASIDFGDLLDGERVRLSKIRRGAIRDIGIKPPKVPEVECIYSWDLQNPHNLIQDENGLVTVTQIGGTMDLCDINNPIITFDASADFTNYHFDEGNLGVANVEGATITKTGIDWNNLNIQGASADATILDLGEEHEDVRVEFFNINAQVASNGDAQVDQADGTLYFGALFDDPRTASLAFSRESNGLKIYTYRLNEDIVYRKNEDSVAFSNMHGELTEIREGVYRVTINANAQIHSELFNSLGVEAIETNGLTISEAGFVGDITARLGVRRPILNNKVIVILNEVSVHVEATRANKEISLTTFDAGLDLSEIFDGNVIAGLNYENQRINWGLDSDARIGKFKFKNLGGEIDINNPINSLDFNGRFGYDGIDELDLELDRFSINDSGISGTVRAGRNMRLPIPGIDGLNIIGFNTTFGQNISGGITLSYRKEAFLGSNRDLHVRLDARVSADGLGEFTIDSNALEDINIARFATIGFTRVSVSPSFENFWISLDGTIQPSNYLFSSNNELEFAGLKISSTGIRVNGFGVEKDVSGSDAQLGGLDLSIEKIGIGFSGDRFYVSVKGGLSLEITEARAGVKLFSDGELEVDSIDIFIASPALSVGGSVAWYKDDAVYGNGFEADLQLYILNMMSLEGAFKIGNKSRKGFYWMAKANVGLSGSPIAVIGPVSVYKVGGGVSYNMEYNNGVFRPDGRRELNPILETTIGTSDAGFLLHGDVIINTSPSSGQINIHGQLFLLSALNAGDNDRSITANIRISPSALDVDATATIEYYGINLNGQSKIHFSGSDKFVCIGGSSSVEGFSGCQGLSDITMGMFGLDFDGYFMLDTRGIAFGAGLDYDEKIGGRCPWARVSVGIRGDAMARYNPLFLRMQAHAHANLDVGCYGASAGVGVSVDLLVQAPPVYVDVEACARFPIVGRKCVSVDYGSSRGGVSEADGYSKLINRIDPIDQKDVNVSLMPKIIVGATYKNDGSVFDIGEMESSIKREYTDTTYGESGEMIRRGYVVENIPLYFKSFIREVNLRNLSENRNIRLEENRLGRYDVQYVPKRILKPNHRYKLTGQMRLMKFTQVIRTPFDENDWREANRIFRDEEYRINLESTTKTTRHTVVKEENFERTFTVQSENRLNFDEVVDYVFPRNGADDIKEGEQIVIYYDVDIVKTIGTQSRYVRDFRIEVLDAKNERVAGRPSFINGDAPKAIFVPNEPLRIYHFCKDNDTGEIMETYILDEGYLNPFEWETEGDSPPVNIQRELSNIPSRFKTGVLTNIDLGVLMGSSDDGRYSYYTNKSYKIVIKNNQDRDNDGNRKIVYLSEFKVSSNNPILEATREIEARMHDITPSLVYNTYGVVPSRLDNGQCYSKEFIVNVNPDLAAQIKADGINIRTKTVWGARLIGSQNNNDRRQGAIEISQGGINSKLIDRSVGNMVFEVEKTIEGIINNVHFPSENTEICTFIRASIEYYNTQTGELLLAKRIEDITEGEHVHDSSVEDRANNRAPIRNQVDIEANIVNPRVNPVTRGASRIRGIEEARGANAARGARQ